MAFTTIVKYPISGTFIVPLLIGQSAVDFKTETMTEGGSIVAEVYGLCSFGARMQKHTS